MAQSKRYITGSLYLYLIVVVFYSSPLLALELKGRTGFSEMYALNSAVSGVVSDVYVSAGQLVKRDEVLIQLDARPFRAKLAEAEALVIMRKPVRDQMLTELERAQELYDRNSLARVVLQDAENKLQIAEGELAAAEAKLQLATYELSQSSVTAPDDLLVLDVNTHARQYINTEVSDQALVVLANHREMLAIAYLGPDQWNADLVGKSARVDYLGRKMQGEVISLEYRRRPNPDSPDGFELRVKFVSRGEIPANMPVTIDIPN